MTTARTKGRANGDSSARADVEATEADEGASGGLRSLDRPFVILRVLRERRAPMRLTEIATAASLHLATTQRIVNLLIKHGYVERDGLDYRLGISSLLNSATFRLTNPLVQISEPILQQVTASTGLTSTLSVRYELTQVLLLRVPSNPPLRYQLPLGEQMPLMVGGARVLAAALSPEDLEALLEGVDNVPLASGLVLGRQEFIDSLRVIRERGYAFGQGQREAGAMSIAVPVFDREGETVAAIQLSSMIEDIPRDVDALVMELKRASAAISRRIP
ncbi:MAG TPA: IclR family transcriptional regulator [Acidimicrobiales bacterium]|nr:IclR family transcriptional regulator [Acidimicrobiales bacterium]